MASPVNGQIAPPSGYKLDVQPPSGYVLDSPPEQLEAYPQAQARPLDATTTDKVASQFPAYVEYLPKVVIHPGTTTEDDDRQVETYQPWDKRNPRPGSLTIEPYHRELLSPEELPNTVAGEMLHHIGAMDYSSDKATPINPDYYALKQKVKDSRTPTQQALDDRIYEEAKKKYPDMGAKDDWLDESRIDEYIMGYIAPDKTDEWRKNGFYNDPKMKRAVEDVRKYLTTPKKKPETK